MEGNFEVLRFDKHITTQGNYVMYSPLIAVATA